MKWKTIHPKREAFDYRPMDEVSEFARRNGLRIRGHTLLWHGANPDWLENADFSCEEVSLILREHIRAVVSRYAEVAYEWDVANEVVDGSGKLRTTENPFLRACGETVIDSAFHWTKEADPSAALYLNDYGLETPGAKLEGVLELARRLRQRGVPVDGVGFQGHVVLGEDSAWTLRRNMDRVSSLGLSVAVTEAEVRIRSDSPPKGEELKRQAAAYARLAEACLGTVHCRTFSVWGFTDKYSWVRESLPGQRAATLLDEAFLPKPAYYSLRNSLAGWWRQSRNP